MPVLTEMQQESDNEDDLLSNNATPIPQGVETNLDFLLMGNDHKKTKMKAEALLSRGLDTEPYQSMLSTDRFFYNMPLYANRLP